MFLKVDDDNDHNEGRGRFRAQGAMAAPGLQPADCGRELRNMRFAFSLTFYKNKLVKMYNNLEIT